MGSYKDKNKGAARAERTLPVCLNGNLTGDWEAAERDLERARAELLGSSSKEGADIGALIDRVRALEAEMLEHTDTWRLRALPRHKFRALVAEYPPRRVAADDSEILDEDRTIGLNRKDFFPALIRASVVEPELDDDDWDWLLGVEGDDDSGVLTDRQFSDLSDVAWFLNRGEVEVPFSHAASLASRDSASE
jgi:hypothetical protein